MVVGVEKIVSEYLAPDNKKNPNRKDENHRHLRLVNWRVKEPIELPRVRRKNFFNQPTVQELSITHWNSICQEYRRKYPETWKVLRELAGDEIQLSDDDAEDDCSEESNDFVPKPGDRRDIIHRQIRQRRGAAQFRRKLMNRYRCRCVVTGCEIRALLEAAHIKPYRGENDNHVQNGLLLRADIHTLFDLDLLGIDPEDMTVVLHPMIRGSRDYSQFHGSHLSFGPRARPSSAALKERFDQFNRKINEAK